MVHHEFIIVTIIIRTLRYGFIKHLEKTCDNPSSIEGHCLYAQLHTHVDIHPPHLNSTTIGLQIQSSLETTMPFMFLLILPPRIKATSVINLTSC